MNLCIVKMQLLCAVLILLTVTGMSLSGVINTPNGYVLDSHNQIYYPSGNTEVTPHGILESLLIILGVIWS